MLRDDKVWAEFAGEDDPTGALCHEVARLRAVRNQSLDSGSPLQDRPKIITLCGSSRFVAEMAVLAWELERDKSVIVMGLHLLPHWYITKCRDHVAEAEGVADEMDELHLRKIDLADRVLVVNLNGYIGESTAREIAYANAHGKPVGYLEEVPDVTD
jgi:hypothetical protein